ncbi:MAG: hypothetical protein JWN15_4328 [Firmicutes bacterium]|nr:hypothetical protein [Bacillota bacterium]
MLRKLAPTLFALMLLVAVPSAALAHNSPGWTMVHTEKVQAGPYTLYIENNEWPVLAQKATPYHVEADGGIANLTVKYRWVPGPAITAKPVTGQLHTDPGVKDAFYLLRSGVPVAGAWHWEFEVDGPKGHATGRSEDFMAGPPPAFPMWLGWLVGFYPVYGLIWFIFREGARRRRAMRLDEGARA